MKKYKIANLIVAMDSKDKRFNLQSQPYLYDGDEDPDFVITIPKEAVLKYHQQYKELSLFDCEQMMTGTLFYTRLLQFNGFLLHSSGVVYENKAYLFSAKSGTGKSTHTELWQKYFGEDKAVIINDDKPAIRLIDDKFYVFGTPWSGKSDKNINMQSPLHAICFIEQAKENTIERLSSMDAINLLLNQTIRPAHLENMDILLALIDKLLLKVPIYKMGCTISVDAAKMAYEAMKG